MWIFYLVYFIGLIVFLTFCAFAAYQAMRFSYISEKNKIAVGIFWAIVLFLVVLASYFFFTIKLNSLF